MLAEKTLLKTAYHFLLLLVGLDTLTYRKDYDRYPTLVGHQPAVGVVGGVEASAAAQPATGGRSRRHDRR